MKQDYRIYHFLHFDPGSQDRYYCKICRIGVYSAHCTIEQNAFLLAKTCFCRKEYIFGSTKNWAWKTSRKSR